MKRRKPNFIHIEWERGGKYLAFGIQYNPKGQRYVAYKLHPTKGWRPA